MGRQSPPHFRYIVIVLLLIQSKCYVHGASYGATYHWIITNTEEAHHLNVCRNGRRTSKLSVRVHTTQCIGHTANGY